MIELKEFFGLGNFIIFINFKNIKFKNKFQMEIKILGGGLGSEYFEHDLEFCSQLSYNIGNCENIGK